MNMYQKFYIAFIVVLINVFAFYSFVNFPREIWPIAFFAVAIWIDFVFLCFLALVGYKFLGRL